MVIITLDMAGLVCRRLHAARHCRVGNMRIPRIYASNHVLFLAGVRRSPETAPLASSPEVHSLRAQRGIAVSLLLAR